VYLNTVSNKDTSEPYWELYQDILSRYRVVSNVLVLDEAIYISKKKYRIPYGITTEFIETAILPYVDILPLGLTEYQIAKDAMQTYTIKPSDALHIGTMQSQDVAIVVSEDSDFDDVDELERIWIS